MHEAGIARSAVSESTGPKVLLVAAFRWISVVRLAFELKNVGFVVEMCCVFGRPLGGCSFVSETHPYLAHRPLTSIRAAILVSRPNILVPCDDVVSAQIRELYQEESGSSESWMRSLITRSLGASEEFAVVASRYKTCAVARAVGVLEPSTEAVDDEESLKGLLGKIGLPAVLKSDGSWGGRGTVVVRNRNEGVRGLRKLSEPPSALRSLKRLVIDRDPTPLYDRLRGKRRGVSIQKYIDGRPANAAVACWQGKVLAITMAEAICTNGPTGQATVIRLISHPGMSSAVECLVARFHLSGLCGFDFVLDTDGRAHFLELNPRATPTCHLISPGGRDLLEELYRMTGGTRAPVKRSAAVGGLIALYPQEKYRDTRSPYIEGSYHDVPLGPEIIKLEKVLRPRKTNAYRTLMLERR